VCLSGPHKDDLAVFLDGQPARQYASQGQTRTAALSLKLGERELHREDTGQWPVLLLDDVLSELDAKRQDFVLRRIDGGQVFITCCGDEPLEKIKNGAVFHIHGGKLV
jgi:DNA replication and repair protein RecF